MIRKNIRENIKDKRKKFRGNLAGVVASVVCLCMMMTGLSVTAWASEKRPGTRLKSSAVGITLTSGTYYVDSNVTIKSKNGPALDIADGADVILYVDSGKTLKCVGADGRCTVAKVGEEYKSTMVAAGAGIHLPEKSSLIIMGSGTVDAQGGDGYANTSGHDATEGSYYRSSKPSESWVKSGRGGTGGTGSGSPAAGIGGNGTNGRDGAVNKTITLTGSYEDAVKDGIDSDGEAGKAGENMGKLYVWDSVKVTATAGNVKNDANVRGGSAADPVSSKYQKYNGGKYHIRLVAAICGGGSAGGKVEGTPNAIGGALGGGAGGTCGATGAIANMRKASTGYMISKLGFVSTFNGKGYTSYCDGSSTCSGHAGAIWEYSGKQHSTFDERVRYQGTEGEGGILCNYKNTTVTGRTNSTKSSLVRAAINLKKDGVSDTDWAKDQKVALYQKETNGTFTKVYEMFNYDFKTGVKSSTFYYDIPADSGELYIYVNDIYAGQILNVGQNDLTATVDAYTTTINLYRNLSPKVDSTVQFYDEGNLAYTFEESKAGVYEAVVVYRPNKTDNNNYEIYVDKQSTQKWLDFSPNNHDMTVNFYDLEVTITEDGINKASQGVTLWRDNKLCYTMWEQEDHSYTYRLIAKQGAPEATGTYDIYVNGIDSGKDIDFSSVAKLSAEIPYITVSVTLHKDNELWTGADVYVTNDSNERIKLSDGGNGTYQKLIKADSWQVNVAGVKSASKKSDILSISNKTMDAEYYTAVFHRNIDGMEAHDNYQSYILRKGDNIPVPLKPASGGGNFSFWSVDSDGTSADFDFTQKIDQTIDLYAIWDQPSVLIGEEIRCDADGKTNGSGSFYKMKNLTLSGFDENYRIGDIQIDYTNIDNITLPDTDLSYDRIDTIGTNSDQTATQRIVLHFENQITVKQAEKLLKEIIVQPTAGIDHTMQVTVYTEPVK